MTMTTYYLLDASSFAPEDWHTDRVTREARSTSAAAEDYAIELADGLNDGQRFVIIVSEHEDGSDAVRLTLRMSVKVSCSCIAEGPIDIPPPGEEGEDA